MKKRGLIVAVIILLSLAATNALKVDSDDEQLFIQQFSTILQNEPDPLEQTSQLAALLRDNLNLLQTPSASSCPTCSVDVPTAQQQLIFELLTLLRNEQDLTKKITFLNLALMNYRSSMAEAQEVNCADLLDSITGRAGIEISLLDNIPSIVANAPENSVFIIKSGTHRLTREIFPKKGDIFIGEEGAVISGAKRLTFTKDDFLWVAENQMQQGELSGECTLMNLTLGVNISCRFPEDVFIDNKPLLHVTSISELGPGKFYFDYDNNKIYLADNPAEKNVETSVTRWAFYGNADDVQIHNLIIEKFAVPAQRGAIQLETGSNSYLAKNWLITNNEIRFNHGLGVRTGETTKILCNNISTNGESGVGGSNGNNILVENNEFASNGYAGFAMGWSSGGMKLLITKNLIVRNNYAHHNIGPGLWTDNNCLNTLYEGNLVTDNQFVGIFNEISYDVTIRNNTVKNNGLGSDEWLYGAQVLISASSNGDIYHNNVVVGVDEEGHGIGDGIALIQQNRSGDTTIYGPHLTINNYVHDNNITYLGLPKDNYSGPYSGMAVSNDGWLVTTPDQVATNKFDHNNYSAPNFNKNMWVWQLQNKAKTVRNWDDFRAAGQESAGQAGT